MMDEATRKRIRDNQAATRQRRLTQSCRAVTLKVRMNKLNKAQRENLKMMFVEAKWLYNHILSRSGEEGFSFFNLKYADFPEVTHYDKDKNEIVSSFRFLPAQTRQSVLDGIGYSVKALSALRKHGKRVGRLRYISEYDALELRQLGHSYKVVGENKIKVMGIRKPLRVDGLEQILSIREYELANAKLIQRNNNYYIVVNVFTPREQQETVKPRIGVDFGCQTTLTFSDGSTINCAVEESERTKELRRRISRSRKGSNNRRKLLLLLRRELEKRSNKKKDIANKICHRLRQYQVVMQDEQVAQWQKNGHGKAVNNGIIGRVKNILMRRDDTILLNRYCPTTKLCRECGAEVSLTQWDRKFVCPDCGASGDRDIHAAQNMLWFAENNIGVGRTGTLEEIRVGIGKKFLTTSALLTQEASDPMGKK